MKITSTFFLMSCICLALLTTNLPLVFAQGVSVPFKTYEAENGTLGGGAAIRSLGAMPTAPTPELEASGQKFVELNATNESISWTTNDPTNTIVVRASIPDEATGGGITATLNLYVNGTFRQALTFTSKYSWVYGVNGFTNNNPSAGTPKKFYDQSRAFISGAAVAAGSTIMLKKEAANTASFYHIDLIQLENVGAALSQPANTLSIVSYGATANDGTDDTQAIKNCVTACKSQGKGMWIPTGTFNNSSRITADGVNIYGAGMWYSTIQRIVSGTTHALDLANCTIQDLYIDNPETARTVAEGHDYGVLMKGAKGWAVQRVWVHRGGACFWLSGTDGTIKDCRATESWADGINLNNGPTADPQKLGLRLTAQNNYIIGSADDGIAINAQNGGGTAGNVVDARVLNNTSIGTIWGNGMRIAGGRNTILRDNLITDANDGNGIRIGQFGTTGNPCESALVLNNLLLRCGGIRSTFGNNSITVADNANATVNSNTINDSHNAGIELQNCTANFTDNTVNHPETTGFRVKSGVSGSAVITTNTVNNLNSGQLAYQNNSPFTFTATLNGNSWQGALDVEWTVMDRRGWTASASLNTGSAGNALDSVATTRWATGTSQVAGQYFIVDMKTVNTIDKIGLDASNSQNDFPAGYEVYMSNDGINWGNVLASGDGTPGITIISVNQKTGRYIKVVQTKSKSGYWSIHEFRVIGKVDVTSLALSPGSATLNGAASQQLALTVLPAKATNKKVTWTSDHPEIAKVNDSGLVTTVSNGVATVTATSKDNPNVKASSIITAVVVNINILASQSFTISENAAKDSVAGVVATSGANAGTTLKNWQITGGTGASIFTIDSLSGVIKLINNGALDYESTTSYSLKVKVSDALVSSAEETVIINVKNENDQVSVITAGQQFTLSESAAAGQPAGIVLATDGDDKNQPGFTSWIWEMTGGAGVFAIDSASGTINVVQNSMLDFEAATSYILNVRVNDGQFTSAEETITINLTNENDNAPAIQAQTYTISESVNQGAILFQATITDADDTNQSGYSKFQNWQIAGGSGAGVFKIDSAGSVKLAANSILDFEQVMSYTINLKVSDGLFNSPEETITINLNNENDNAPVITGPLSFAIDGESNNLIGKLNASDADDVNKPGYTSLVNWAIVGGSGSSLFSINPNTGVIMIASLENIDFNSHSYELLVKVSDGINESNPKQINVTISNNINVCHNGHVISISRNAVKAHIKHGCTLGSCGGNGSFIASHVNEDFNLQSISQPSIIIYPNPVLDKLQVNLGTEIKNVRKIMVSNLSGQTVLQQAVNGETLVVLNFDQLITGMYVVTIIADEVKTFKVVKQ
ncbi:MAG: uncharacterized protein JWN56_346 [Sphingobacteriales bacterium]|nr:uncharacterized protein [Sphingobacteriales bacterium]